MITKHKYDNQIIASSDSFVATHYGRRFVQAWRACPGYNWRAQARLSAVEPREVSRGESLPELQFKPMSLEDFVVFFRIFCYRAERSKVLLLSLHVVVGPLWWGKNDECVTLCMLFVGGFTLTSGNKGWFTPWIQLWYDCIMGYPGEDLFPQLRVVY